MQRKKLPYGQRYMTPEEVKAEMKQRQHTVPPPEEWEKDEVVSGIGIYKTREGVMCYWLIGVSDDVAGR